MVAQYWNDPTWKQKSRRANNPWSPYRDVRSRSKEKPNKWVVKSTGEKTQTSLLFGVHVGGSQEPWGSSVAEKPWEAKREKGLIHGRECRHEVDREETRRKGKAQALSGPMLIPDWPLKTERERERERGSE